MPIDRAFDASGVLAEWAAREPSRLALIDDDHQQYTYAKLHRLACRIAGGLREVGVTPGTRVAMSAPNGMPFLASWFGILYAGACVVPIGTRATTEEVASRIAHSRSVVFLHAAGIRKSTACKTLAIETLLDASEVPPVGATTSTAMILYTSGTTAAPKGARISHRSLRLHCASLAEHSLAFTPQTRSLGTLPWTHSFGIRTSVLAVFHAGGSTVAMPRFDAAKALEEIRRHEVSFLPAVPTMFHRLANAVESGEHAPTSVTLGLSAGAPLHESDRRRASTLLSTDIRQGYGLTEATFSAIDGPPSRSATPGTVGRAVRGVSLRIVEPNTTTSLADDTPGELQVQGPNVMEGYLDDEEATRSVFTDDGWIKTGDLATLSQAGTLTIVDRIKDLVIRGGFNIVPTIGEQLLVQHDAVSQVAVVGKPDRDLGQECVAVIELHALSELSDSLRSELLELSCEAGQHAPRRILFIEEMPLGPSGKILKRRLLECLDKCL